MGVWGQFGGARVRYGSDGADNWGLGSVWGGLGADMGWGDNGSLGAVWGLGSDMVMKGR